MTAFDAPRPSDASSSRRAAAAVAAQPAVVLIAVIAGALALTVAIVLCMAGRATAEQIREMVAATAISVFIDPQSSRADSLALGARLKEQPPVLGASLRTKEDALAALDRAVLPSLRDAQNPLPDVWIVMLRLPEPATPRPSLAAFFSATGASLSALPGVDSIRMDLPWVAILDGWLDRIDRYREVAAGTVAGALVVALLAIAFMAGRALQARGTGTVEAPNARALAWFGLFLGLASVAIALSVRWVLIGVLPADVPARWRPMVESGALLDTRILAGLCAGALLASVIGAMAAYRSDSHNTSYLKRDAR